MKPISNIIVIILTTIIITFSISCKIPKVQIATSIELYSGGSQRGEVNTELEKPIVVIIKDQDGDIYTGLAVKFDVSKDSAFYDVVLPGGTFSDYEGKVNAYWTLGRSDGIYTMQVIALRRDSNIHLEGSPLIIYAQARPFVSE